MIIIMMKAVSTSNLIKIGLYLVESIDQVLSTPDPRPTIETQVCVSLLLKNKLFDDVEHLTRLRE